MIPFELLDAIIRLLLPRHKVCPAEMRAARTTLASCAQTCQTLHELAIKYLWQEQDLIGICKAVLPTLAVGRVKWPGQIEVQGVEEADSDDDASDDGNIYSARVYQHACGKPLFPELRELVWEHATPELLSVISPSIRILSLPGSPEEEEDASLQRKFACDMRRHAFKQLIPAVVQGLPDLEEVVLRSFGHKSFWFPFTSTPNSGFVNQNIRILHMSESSRTLMKAALAAVSTIQNLSELAIDVLRTDIDTEPARLPTSSISPFIKLVQLSVKGPTTAVAALVNVIDAPFDVFESVARATPFLLNSLLAPLRRPLSLYIVFLTVHQRNILPTIDMPAATPPPTIPLDVVEEILCRLSPETSDEHRPGNHPGKEIKAARAALARCARACRALRELAARVLWREQDLSDFCGAVLLHSNLGFVKWPTRMGFGDVFAGDGGDDDTNADMAVGVASNYPYTYYYLPGPIVSADEWARFAHYASFVRVLHHRSHTIDSSVFAFLQQHARGKPLFPGVRELTWAHATPDILSVISPSIRILRLYWDRGTEVREYWYRVRRHALKQLLPTILRELPELEELHFGSLGHEAFWDPLKSVPSGHVLSQNVHILHISDSCRALARAGLSIISTLTELVELKIAVIDGVTVFDPQLNHVWDASSIRTFANLRRLRLDGRTTTVAALLNAIVAPKLEDFELTCRRNEEDETAVVDGGALYAAFDLLRRRHAASLRIFKFHFQYPSIELFPSSATEPGFSTTATPLLKLRHLEHVEILLYYGQSIELEHTSYVPISACALLAAWPSLHTLSLPGSELFPNMLQDIARAGTKLHSLTAQEFYWMVPRLLADDFPRLDTALRQLRIETYDVGTSGIDEISRFLDSLFPHLDIELCSVPCRTRDPPAATEIEAINHHDVMKAVKELQLARHIGTQYFLTRTRSVCCTQRLMEMY
ncbi:hypothetical protein EVJ58_g2703 [Rhodofomes roseus]|uniref:F-box domain-containing protein n=1 Tax=Rhodofomes roseus TaxID=34475 RepID=A0A4Y9YRC3_9APHY|nr:hypothetical protein EVJ58_g2703 [Rhodofomes roseus]